MEVVVTDSMLSALILVIIARTASLQVMYAQESNAPSGRVSYGRRREGGREDGRMINNV